MSYAKFRDEHGGEFAKFLKADKCKKLPITLTLLRVDEQELPNSGETLVARFALDAKARAQLKPEYVKELDDLKVQDIGLPLNKTNGDRLAKMLGDKFEAWHGAVTLYAIAVTNPKDKKEVESLRVQVTEDEE
jgi:hypothetical protein